MRRWLATVLVCGVTASHAMTQTEVQHFVNVLGFSEADAPRAISERDDLVNSMSRAKIIRCFELLHLLNDERVWIAEFMSMGHLPLAKQHFERFKQVQRYVQRETCMTDSMLELQQNYVNRLERYFKDRS